MRVRGVRRSVAARALERGTTLLTPARSQEALLPGGLLAPSECRAWRRPPQTGGTRKANHRCAWPGSDAFGFERANPCLR